MIKRILDNKAMLLKIGVLIAISLLYLGRSFNDFKQPFIEGDGIEYVMMTEAFVNHGSPDIRHSDFISFKARYSKSHKWDDLYCRDVLDGLTRWLQEPKKEFLETNGGFYVSKDKNLYCQHFFFYSLINVPSYIIGKHYGPLRTFYFTNAILVIITCLILLFFTPFTLSNQILAALCFCFSSCYWYLAWEHAEIFTMCLTAIALVNFFNQKYYTAILLLALACLQNQPLTLLLGFVCLVALINKGINKRNIIIIGCLGAIALVPPLFYYFSFGTTNLIKDAGFLDTKFITVNRVSGFYTDFNQGMILTIPLILLLYIPLLFLQIRRILKKEESFDLALFIPLVVLTISITVSTMGNWNHGMAIINRYATWLSIVIMIHVFYLANQHSVLTKAVLFNYFFMSQCFTTLYHHQFNKFDWSSARHTPLSKWILREHQELYNPDPVIFAARIRPTVELVKENSPIIYFHKKLVKKVMVHREKIDDLVNFGYSVAKIKEMKEDISFNYDWGYVDMFKYKSAQKGSEAYYALKKRKLQAVYDKIQTSPSWKQQVLEKANIWGKTYEEACWIDAEYILNMEEAADNED